MRAGVAGALVEAQAGDEARLVGAELHAELDGRVVDCVSVAGRAVAGQIVHGQAARGRRGPGPTAAATSSASSATRLERDTAVTLT